MKPYQEQLSSKVWSMWQHAKTFFFWRILYFWYILEFIHKFIIELHILQCFFERGSNKKEGRGRIISNATKFFFLISYDNQVLLGGNLMIWPPFLDSPRKALSLGKKKIYLDTQLKAELTGLFWKLSGCFLFSRVGIEW